MIGGLLFRYWEGGTATRSGNPNVYVNWAQKKRPEQRPAPAPETKPAEPVVLVPLPAVCQPGRIGVAGTAPVAFARTSIAQAQSVGRLAVGTAVLAVAALRQSATRAALPDTVGVSVVAPHATAQQDPDSQRRLGVIEHNRRAIAAIAAAMLADAD
jgi:hypothetical protein